MENKDKKSDKNINNKGIKYIYNKLKIVNKKKVIFLMLIICIAYIINASVNCLKKTTEQSLLFVIIFITIFSKYILKENYYKHHYLSFVIDIIGIIIILIPNYLRFSKDNLIYYLFELIRGICISLFFVIIKYLNKVYYLSVFKIGFLVGIITTVLNIFGFIIYSLIKYHDLGYFNECFDFSEVENIIIVIVYLLLVLILFTFSQIFIYLTLFNFSPYILIIAQTVIPFILFILDSTMSEPAMPNIVVCTIGYFIALFSSLVFNEIIILTFCGLNKNTKKFVNERMETELIELKDRDSQYDDRNTIEVDDIIDG